MRDSGTRSLLLLLQQLRMWSEVLYATVAAVVLSAVVKVGLKVSGTRL